MYRLLFLIPVLALTLSFKEKQQPVFSEEALSLSYPSSGDTLKINDLIFADFFSPNSDGYNDQYIILNVLNYPTNTFKVFNRWGEMVYYASPYKNEWNGKTNQSGSMLGEDCSPGVYYFEFNDGTGNIATGHITLKR
ncbi:gliding motility-associated C-terminal domain-containing protein [Fluviicola sp.]|uniref:T9SS type B sorting domain-containing protein n=1 Tax=Fluviicola sp. TaxID=1917219 RepID=UPI0031D598BC